ncbi:MAG: iron uptake transporter deferrochelatase/peroxidase subunit [Verrucomicrobiia bacterium]|jgi:deferrochelatase/peroxidase EfeB
MNESDERKPNLSRRGFLAKAGGLVAAAAGAGLGVRAATDAIAAMKPDDLSPPGNTRNASEPFWGQHQAGILTPPQSHTYFAAFDLVTSKRDDVIKMLRAWTAAAARMATAQTASLVGPAADIPQADTGEALGFPPARLTITFGFGAGLFTKDGNDRYGLAAHRPDALVDLPRFNGDQLVDAHTGGDLSVQACADDPQVAFHAVRQLALAADYVAQLRWAQTGFITRPGPKETPRNLMGFKDGTSNPSVTDPNAMGKFVWVGGDGPDWMRGGSYLVIRRIRMALEHWDRLTLAFQEQTVGRQKSSGAPLGGQHEFDSPDLAATDKDGNPVIPENSHVRLAVAETNDGARILRRPYSYNDGVNFNAERWPPWRQGMEYDAGLLFICYQQDPRTGFIKIFNKMSKYDMMNQFVTHTGGGLFACPGGIAEGGYIGQRLFESA